MEILYGAGALDHELKKMAFLADKKLILASPFFKLDPEMERILALKKSEGTQIILFTRTGTLDLKRNPQKYLTQIFNHSRLHTKLYVSETTAIFASANLYEFSLQNNHEMGLLFSKQWDEEAFDKLNSEIQFWNCPVSESIGVQLVWSAIEQKSYNESSPKGQLAEHDQIKDACNKCGIEFINNYTGIHRVGEEIFIFCSKSSVKDVSKAKKYKLLWNDYILGPLGIGHFQCTASDINDFFDEDNRVKSQHIKIFVDNIYYEQSEIYCYQLPDKEGDFKWIVVFCTKENRSNKARMMSLDDPVLTGQSEISCVQDDPFSTELPTVQNKF